MSSETRLAGSSAAVPSVSSRPLAWLRVTGIVLLASAFVALCAQVALPLYFTPVPLTLQPFAVLLIGLLLSPRLAGASLLTYLAEGALGLPVFAPAFATGPASAPGLAHLFGPTGGYLLAYPFAAMLISMVYQRSRRGFLPALLSAAAGSLLILSVGAVWLGMLTHASAAFVLMQSVVPFLPGDALKIIAAASLASGWQRWRDRHLRPNHTI
jgi:biotin transport system substrate-specific component